MKKFLMAACALAVMGFVACSKDDNATTNNEVKVNFTVADKASFDGTRAAKSAWANGDEIMVVFCPDGTSNWGTTNILKLTYNGSWSASDISSFISTLGEGGEYQAYHYRGDVGFETAGEATIFKNYKGGDFLQCKGEYTVSGNELTLTDEIAMAFYDENVFQVSVKGLDQSKTWKMSIYYNYQVNEEWTINSLKYMYFCDNSISYSDGISTLAISTSENYYRATGVNNSDGDVSFWVYKPSTEQITKHYCFYIESAGVKAYKYCKAFETEAHHLVGGKHYRLPEIKTENIEYTGTFNGVEGKWNWKSLE